MHANAYKCMPWLTRSDLLNMESDYTLMSFRQQALLRR